MTATPEQRVGAEVIANFTGIPSSTIIKLAQQRRIPATKIGRRWRFSVSRVDQWIKEREEANLCRSPHQESVIKSQRIASNAVKRGGLKSSFQASDTDAAYAQMMRGKQRSGLNN
ncbi:MULTISPECIES: helix-turn-helix domain-containing protein [unclassified Saccharibacter]|uniref:helix-turn-helix domain-containing protein n=1 Tax=unclassified Saccharibacter TaxID=2648722 RepID=UPI001322EA1B|nr:MULTISPECIES: helix-turn-helix domain-containing protein [unclassified Saccharibacter]MXV35253.1 helix-turn-helix domain-containing protein [Saccharibacter sp. EH611]MXV57899.1 helix-turn-helix domain-containing protein [Saccharibacter sp. EH70]MXV65187.1 helix-turn-helix domain-containing protein [Saccharibacter sp. EH60]MXV65930.1 helix-turn-helix domain-containing protein [Saccharibacter sp. EH60]